MLWIVKYHYCSVKKVWNVQVQKLTSCKIRLAFLVKILVYILHPVAIMQFHHILAENTYIYEPYRIKRTQNSYRRFPPSFISLSSKSFVNIISYGPKITNYKDETINHSNIYFLLDLFQREKHFVKVCNTRKFDLSCSIKVSFREIIIMYKAR